MQKIKNWKIIFSLLSFMLINHSDAKDGEFIVKFKKNTKSSLSSLMSYYKSRGLEIIDEVNGREKLFLAKVQKNDWPSKIISIYSKFEDIEYIEENQTLYALDNKVLPNDPMLNSLWGMQNKAAATKGADIKAPNAWSIHTGNKNIVVAVIDTGVDYTHPDLKDNMWSKKVDGKVVYGFNAITGALDPKDDNGHGTHCAGTIGARGNNGMGVAGVAWSTQIMGVKFLDRNGSGDLSNAVKAIDWALDNGAKVLSNSWGGGKKSQALQEAFQRARDKGVLMVVAAGNSRLNNDSSEVYPANFTKDFDNVIVVGASGRDDLKASFTNYEMKNVHLFAPGVDILSTLPNNTYGEKSGTSMAAPHVSGAAALYWSRNPSLKYSDVKKKLLSSVDRVNGLVNLANTKGGRLNLEKLLK